MPAETVEDEFDDVDRDALDADDDDAGGGDDEARAVRRRNMTCGDVVYEVRACCGVCCTLTVTSQLFLVIDAFGARLLAESRAAARAAIAS
jgi:hypothetical protein